MLMSVMRSHTVAVALVLVALVLVAFGCARGTADPRTAAITLGQPFELALGATARVPDSPHSVTFEAVPQDSRCPAGAMCVWAGEATVRLRVISAGEDVRVTLSDSRVPRSAVVGALEIELLSVLGGRAAPGDTAAVAYRAQLVLRRT